MKLSEWSKKEGIHYQTAWRWFKTGKIPNAYVSTSGSVFVKDEITNNLVENNVIYCRVSNHSRKKELNFQVDRCEKFCSERGIVVNKKFKEVASGMNENRKEFWKMIHSKPTSIVVENKDRLSRFGFKYLKVLLEAQNCKIIVINEVNEDKEDLVKDLVSIIYSFCARLYGMRRAKNKADKIRKVIEDDKDS